MEKWGWTVSKVQEATASCKLRSVNLIFTALTFYLLGFSSPQFTENPRTKAYDKGFRENSKHHSFKYNAS